MFNLKSSFWLVLLCLILAFPLLTSAQTSAQVILFAPETEEFPQISALLKVYDGQGQFVHQLRKEHLSILEDGQRIPLDELALQERGAQFVVAINLGPTFAIRDVNGISRFDKLRQILAAWASGHTAAHDDLSLLVNEGPEALHLSQASEWLASLNAYDPNPRLVTPSLDVLVRALSVASDPMSQTGMGKGILLLTPPPDRTSAGTIQSIISLARQENIRIHIWMVSSPAYFTSEGAIQLQELASETRGTFHTFSNDEPLPDIETLIDPLRFTYALRYTSQIRNSEPHNIVAAVKYKDLDITSESLNLDIQIQPPNPIFLSPPLEITRANLSSLETTLAEASGYSPKEQRLEILIEFPDGRPRPLERTTLYVDGVIADVNTEAPFDNFTWNLEAYTQSSDHVLQVEVQDSLGLQGTSIEHVVRISVQQTPQSVLQNFLPYAPLVGGVAVAIAGGVLLLSLIVKGRIQPKSFGRRRKNASRSRPQEMVPPNSEAASTPARAWPLPKEHRFSNWRSILPWPHRPSNSREPIAYLELLQKTNGNQPENRIAVEEGEITFGRDPVLATVTFKDPSVDPLHARLKVKPEQEIQVFDNDSTAGTWVNYQLVPPQGVALQHGDILHFGRVELRFVTADQTQIPKPVIASQEPHS